MRLRLRKLRAKLGAAKCTSDEISAVMREIAEAIIKEATEWLQVIGIKQSETN